MDLKTMDTGGGCQAWRVDMGKKYALLTDFTGSMPPVDAPGEPVLVGFYTLDGDDIGSVWEFDTLANALKAVEQMS